MKVHRLLADTLAAHEITTMFGLLGDGNMLYVADYVDAGHGRFVGTVHESGATSMADGFFRFSGRFGVASLTRGPGFTNAMTALVEAVRNRSQVLLIVGDTGSSRGHPQSLDTAAVASAAGAGHESVHSAATLTRDVDRAIRRIAAERRPVVLSASDDVLMEDAGDATAMATIPAVPGPVTFDPDALDRALGVVASANRPLVLAGRGAVEAGARDELVRLADVLGAPLATSLLGKDLFAGHRMNLGISGSVGSDVGLAAIAEADTVVVFGAGLNQHTTARGELLRGKRVVHCDIDPARIGASTPVHEAVVGDAALVAAAMNAGLAEAGIRPSTWAEKYVEPLATASPRDEFVDRSDAQHVDVRTAIIRLDEVLPRDRTVISDVGRFTTAAWRYLHVEDPTRFTQTGAFGSLGLGVGTAIGAAVGSPDGPVMAIAGDGGFMMHAAELSTAVRHGIPLLVVVLNDGSYGAEFHSLKVHGVDPAHSLIAWPDLAPLAEALGARGITIRAADGFDQLTDLVADLDRPTLVDVKLDPYVDIRD